MIGIMDADEMEDYLELRDPKVGIPSFSRMKYSLLRWARLASWPRLMRALVIGMRLTMAAKGFLKGTPC